VRRGINLVETRFPVRVDKPKAPGAYPDIADIIYGIHRLHRGHGEALPGGFELLHDAAGTPGHTRIKSAKVTGNWRVRLRTGSSSACWR